MNIAVLTSSFPEHPEDSAAAAGLFVRDFCVELARAGHRVQVLTQAKSDRLPDTPPELTVHWYPWRGRDTALAYLKPWRPADALAALSLFRAGYAALRRLHGEEPFDHVFALWAVPAGLMARWLHRRCGVPYTVWCLGSDIWTYGKYPLLRRVVASVLRDADHRYADGIALAEQAARLGGVPCAFLPSSRAHGESTMAAERPPGEGPRFLFVGRYAPVKGVDILLEAMARYRRGGGAGHLYLFGGGPMEAEIRQRADGPELAGSVTVGGLADRETYLAQLRACDCFLIPSRMESIPLVLSDALHSGRPLIVSDVGDMGHLLRETPAGLVVPPEDPAALAVALGEMSKAEPGAFDDGVRKLAAQFDLANSARVWEADVERGAGGWKVG